VVTARKAKTYALEYKEEKRICTDIVFEAREIETVETETVMMQAPSCSAGGHCSPTLEPITRNRVVKKTIYEAVPKEKIVVVRIPYLKEVEGVVVDKTLLLESHTEIRKFAYGVVVPDVPNSYSRVLVAPQAPCHCSPLPEKKGEENKAPETPREQRSPAEASSSIQQLPPRR
jgi:hypothetical protein